MPRIATEGFNYAFAYKPSKSETGFWGDDPAWIKSKIYKVDLKYANDIYVVDEQRFVSCRYYLGTQDENQRRFTEEELTTQYSVISGTITPLEEYQNNFEKPMYLIHRPLWPDEAVDISDQWELWLDDTQKAKREENIRWEKRLNATIARNVR